MGNHDVSAEQSFAEAERLYEQNKFTAARRSYEEAICYAPNHSDAHFGLGLALIALGECALAKQPLR